ncbi:NADP-dependent 3-hydroxy acid dehydrogenase YdfG [Anseongella ginsenosidimutans]|uniref:NADP-dependent 3-hydroxy acid dehydrogenase YdfG n=1 Tax=Anseongella ginsenosidimutans TaxID=496056 RepID=A0A4R3KSN9_9SPHI|nr:SDR family oxidoreductase [Anseongella ginsenosidimutans]QEC52863.1 SDR family oxidoreductase [Anseongella ginsenosidimutans]TCS87253.1 NADP-dependent 3-hydroxy acid dehydrogenase YdfG [Anseongella ginsenosidimutans]
MNPIEGKIILVTGAGRGLGAAICKTLSAEGGTTILTDIQPQGLESTLKEIKGQGCNARSFIMDVGNEESVQEVMEKVIAEYGGLDIVINNAGIDYTKSIEELSLDEWDRVMSVNLRGPFIISKAAFPHLRKSGRGHIVNIVSTACKRTWANASAYHASKWGLLGFTHAMHVEARKENIKVTAVVAGGMQTPFILDRFPETDLKFLQDPQNVADTIRYVLSQPAETVIPEIMVIPMTETSWP